MNEVIFWWFYNVAEPFSEFAGAYAAMLSATVFVVATLIAVLYFSRTYPFALVMAMSVGVGAITLISYFPIVMFLPFVILALGGGTCFIGICYMLYASVKGKPE